MDKLALVAAALLGGAWLWRHLSAYNRRTCRRCKGAGELRSGLLSARTRVCPRCAGRGKVRGLGGRPE